MSYDFLQYCHDNKITAPGYPPHGTHVYQSLDVCIFAPLKAEFGRLRDKLFYEDGEVITKDNFLKVYGKAHMKVLTPELIKKAFAKVGIVPVNRNVITPEMMAPSKDTSHKVYTPIIPTTPVRVVSDLLMDAIEFGNNGGVACHANKVLNVPPQPVRFAIAELAKTEYGFLVSNSPIKSSQPVPDMPTVMISPVKKKAVVQQRARDEEPTQRELEAEERALLAEEKAELAEAKAMALKSQLLKAQSTVVFQRVWCRRVRQQLGEKEKKGRQNGDGGKLDDNAPFLLTSNEQIAYAKAKQDATAAAAREKEERRNRRKKYAAELEEWQKAEEERKKVNGSLDLKWKKAVEDWKRDKLEAKLSGMKIKDWTITHPLPKKSDAQFKPKPQIPKPKLMAKCSGDAEESEGEEFNFDVSSEDEE